MTNKVFLITGNPEKLYFARKAFEQTNIQLEQINPDYREVQASSSLEVARHTIEKFIGEYDRPIIREDHSLYLDGIPGFPGPYLSYFDERLDAEKLLELVEGKKRTGYFEVGTVLGLPNGEIKEYQFQVPIKISNKIRGNERNWDRILMLEDSNETFSGSNSGKRAEIWNQNLRRIIEKL